MEIAKEQGINVFEGVYCMTAGPQYETPAEVRMLKGFGADALGSTFTLFTLDEVDRHEELVTFLDCLLVRRLIASATCNLVFLVSLSILFDFQKMTVGEISLLRSMT